MTLFRTAFRILAPQGVRSRLTVLIFHRVLQVVDPLRIGVPDVVGFEQRMRWVRRWFNVIPLADAVRGLACGNLPERPLCITFDDGYADNATLALPILRGLGLHATFFITSGFLNGGRMWNDTVIEAIRAYPGNVLDLEALELGQHPTANDEDKRQAVVALLSALKYRPNNGRTALAERIERLVGARLPQDLMMTSQQVAQLHGCGMEIGAHTVNHPILLGLDEETAREEIATSKSHLEDITGAPVTLFAYPNGFPGRDYGLEHVRMVKALGFQGAVSTAWGIARPSADPFQVPRFTPWDASSWKYGARLLQNLLRAPADRVRQV